MIRHCFRLVWNRKGENALITLEIAISLLVVFAVAALAVYHLRGYRQPLGFDVTDVWSVRVARETGRMVGEDGLFVEDRDSSGRIAELMRELEAMEPVAAAAYLASEPYSSGAWTSSTDVDGRRISRRIEEVSTGVGEVLGLELVAGRWLEPADEQLHWQPVVVNRRLARELFGDADPLGREVFPDEPPEQRVVGVVEDYRRSGELSPNMNVVLQPAWPADAGGLFRLRLLAKVQPGTPAAFEEEMVRRLQAVAPDWSFSVRPLEVLRERHLREELTPLLAAALVAVFLIAMVALGLVGVLWQNVTRRTREIGLRRASGATAREVYRQVLLEMLVVTTLGVALAGVVVAQLPLSGWLGEVELEVYALGFGAAVAVLYGLVVLCGLYPSWLAARVQPAEALRYE